SFRCSPPRVSTTQLRFDTARFFTAQKRTFTASTKHPLGRTSAAFTPPPLRTTPRTPAKFLGGGTAHTVKRPEGRPPVTMGAGPNPTYAAKPSRSGLEGDRVLKWLDGIELKLPCKFDAIRFN